MNRAFFGSGECVSCVASELTFLFIKLNLGIHYFLNSTEEVFLILFRKQEGRLNSQLCIWTTCRFYYVKIIACLGIDR